MAISENSLQPARKQDINPRNRALVFAIAAMLLVASPLWTARVGADLDCQYDEKGLPHGCKHVPTAPHNGAPECDWDCKQSNREQMRQHRAWKANLKGNEALNKGEFDRARSLYRNALQQVPGYGYALNNLALVNQNELAASFNLGRTLFDSGDFQGSLAQFNLAARVPGGSAQDYADVRQWIEFVTWMSRYKHAGSLLMQGTGAQIGWSLKPPPGGFDSNDDRVWAITAQLSLARREIPAGVDVGIYNMGLGIAVSTSEIEDLARRVLLDQLSAMPVPPSAMSGYNAIKDRRFDLLGCHSNGANTCLIALQSNDASARDVVLYGPQITPFTAAIWQQLLSQHKIRSLRIVINQNDPVPALAMLVNSHSYLFPSNARLLGQGTDLKATISSFVPNAQIEVHQCSFSWRSPLGCHRMTAYPQCKPGRSTKSVAGTRGYPGSSYREPPPPQC